MKQKERTISVIDDIIEHIIDDIINDDESKIEHMRDLHQTWTLPFFLQSF